jgi:hypothetical protein
LQGSKVWPVYYDCEIWAHHSLRGQEKHLWFKHKCSNGFGSEKHIRNNVVQPEYFNWRDSLFNCKHPIRYPNGFKRTAEVSFSLLLKSDGTEERLGYIEARKKIYIDEYCRLIRKLPEYAELRETFLNDNKTLIICETDVPDNEVITIEKLEKMACDKNIRFGHGLCIAWELIKDNNAYLNEFSSNNTLLIHFF